MNGKPGRRCALCERHQKMQTVDGTVFWMEYGDDDRPRLCMDSLHKGGGLNVLCIRFCPVCGRECEIITDKEDDHAEQEEYPGGCREERGQAGSEQASGRKGGAE